MDVEGGGTPSISEKGKLKGVKNPRSRLFGDALERLKKFIKDNIIVGLIFFGPIFGTIYVLIVIFRFIDGILSGVYKQIFGFHVPGLGFISLFFLIVVTGALARTYLATLVLQLFESIISKIPVAKSIYSALKNITEMFQRSDSKLGKPKLLKLGGMYLPGIEVTSDKDFSVFLFPSTPNPTTGFVFIIPKEKLLYLGTSVDDFMKFMVSLGLYSSPLVNALRAMEEKKVEKEESQALQGSRDG